MAKYLTKDEELHLGGLIQNMLKANARMKEASVGEATLSATESADIDIDIRKGVLAVEKLVEANVDLVRGRAHAFKSRYPGAPDVEDLIQEGMTGLMTAVYKYDPSKGNKFSTVAYYWIVQAIGRGTNKTGRLVRLPENRVQDFINISKVRSQYEESGLTNAEVTNLVMAETGLSFGEIVDITNAASTPASLNKVVNSGDDSAKELIDYVGEDHVSESSEDFVLKNEMFEILSSQLGDMTEVARDVISSAFMMEGITDTTLTNKMVREKHNLSAPRFKKILNESLLALRKDLDGLSIEFKDFLD